MNLIVYFTLSNKDFVSQTVVKNQRQANSIIPHLHNALKTAGATKIEFTLQHRLELKK